MGLCEEKVAFECDMRYILVGVNVDGCKYFNGVLRIYSEGL